MTERSDYLLCINSRFCLLLEFLYVKRSRHLKNQTLILCEQRNALNSSEGCSKMAVSPMRMIWAKSSPGDTQMLLYWLRIVLKYIFLKLWFPWSWKILILRDFSTIKVPNCYKIFESCRVYAFDGYQSNHCSGSWGSLVFIFLTLFDLQ